MPRKTLIRDEPRSHPWAVNPPAAAGTAFGLVDLARAVPEFCLPCEMPLAPCSATDARKGAARPHAPRELATYALPGLWAQVLLAVLCSAPNTMLDGGARLTGLALDMASAPMR